MVTRHSVYVYQDADDIQVFTSVADSDAAAYRASLLAIVASTTIQMCAMQQVATQPNQDATHVVGNDVERPQTQFSMSRHSLTLNMSKTAKNTTS